MSELDLDLAVAEIVTSLQTTRKNYSNRYRKIRWKGGTWATEETIRFWW